MELASLVQMAEWVFPAQVTLTQSEGQHRHSGLFGEPLSRKQTWFLWWEGNQVARAQLATGEWPVCTGSMSAVCRNAARSFSLGCQLWEWALPSQSSVVQGCAVQSHLWVCSHGSCSSPSVEAVLCALLGLSEGRAQPRSWENTRAEHHHALSAAAARTGLLKSCPALLPPSPLSHGKPH